MTAGEGGILVTKDEELAERVESLTWSGRKRGRPWYEHYELGWNYRMTEFQGAILQIQLSRLEEQNKRRRENAAYLSEKLHNIGGLEPVRVDPRAKNYSVHIFIIRFNPKYFKGLTREKLVDAINKEGIPIFGGYTHPLYKNPMFLNKSFYQKGCPITCSFYQNYIDYESFSERCPVSERACAYEALWLEHRLFLGTKSDMDDIADAFQKVKDHVDEII
jgi:dTDP-4-amino-4,6-dideoxygalactose transaminase